MCQLDPQTLKIYFYIHKFVKWCTIGSCHTCRHFQLMLVGHRDMFFLHLTPFILSSSHADPSPTDIAAHLPSLMLICTPSFRPLTSHHLVICMAHKPAAQIAPAMGSQGMLPMWLLVGTPLAPWVRAKEPEGTRFTSPTLPPHLAKCTTACGAICTAYPTYTRV